MPMWNDDEVRAQLKRIEEMCQRDARAFGTDPMVEPRIIRVPEVHIRHDNEGRVEEFIEHQRINLEGYPVGQMGALAAPGFGRSALNEIQFTEVSMVSGNNGYTQSEQALVNQIQTLQAEREVLYKHLAQQEEEIKALKAQRDSTLTKPIFKRSYK